MKFLRLRKSAEEINFEKDLMEAGKSKGKKDKVSEEQLEIGKEVEKEHTTNTEIAEKITRDHLEEIPDYYTHLKKMEDAVKKESAIQQPNKPKPTTTLPDNMEWSWDPNAADWVAVMKNNTNVTPPLYNPQNQNLVNQNTTSYMSNIKSASVIDDENLDEIIKELSNNAFYIKTKKGTILPVIKKDNKFFISGEEVKNKNTIKYLEEEYNKEVVQDIKKTYNHLLEDLEYELWDAGQLSIPEEKILDILLKKNIIKRTPGIKGEHETANGTAKWIYMLNKKQSSCLSKFLDGPQYSKEIKIEAGLIKNGLVKYAGFDFNRGTKYTITTKGLEVLRRASEAEHNEALNEREKLAYLFGFNTDEITTLDTTGKVIKSDDVKKFNVKSLINKLYSEIKKSRKHWEGIDPLEYTHIDAKNVDGGIEIEVRDELSYEGMEKLAELLNKTIKEIDSQAYFEQLEPGIIIAFISDDSNIHTSLNKFAKKFTICEADGSELGEIEAQDEIDAKVKFGIEHPEYADSQSIKAVCAQYEQTTEQHLDYPNPSETPHTDVIIENHDGWVNTADQKTPYTEEQKRLLPLFKLLNKHVLNKEIVLEEDVQNENATVASGTAEVINDLEHEVKDLGFYCEPIAEIVDNSYIGKDIYSLRIFHK